MPTASPMAPVGMLGIGVPKDWPGIEATRFAPTDREYGSLSIVLTVVLVAPFLGLAGWGDVLLQVAHKPGAPR